MWPAGTRESWLKNWRIYDGGKVRPKVEGSFLGGAWIFTHHVLLFKKRDELLRREAAYWSVTCCKARNTQAEIFPMIFLFLGGLVFLPHLSFSAAPSSPSSPPYLHPKSQAWHFPQFLITSSYSDCTRKFDVSSSFGRLYGLQLGPWPTHSMWVRNGHERPRSVGVFVFSRSLVF